MRRGRTLAVDSFLRWAVVGGVGLLFLALSVQEIRSADFWWQLRTGQWVVEHRALPQLDEFTYTVRGHAWIEVRWLFFVLIYLGWLLGGAPLLILAQTAALALSYFVLARSAGRVATTLPGLIVLILGIWAASARFVVRPELVTFMMVSVYLVVLDGFRRGRHPRAVFTLPLAQIVWSSSHTLFILGPVIAWLFAAGSIGSQSFRRLVWIAVAVTAACSANAYGLRGALFPFLLFKEIHASSILGRAIEELRSPFALDAWSWDLVAGALLAVVSGATFLVNRRKTDLARLALWAAVLYLAGQSVRNVALFALVGTWAALRNLEDASAAGRAWAWSSRMPRAAPPAGRLALVAATLFGAWYVATDRYAVRHGLDQRFGLGIVPWYQPAAATDFLLANRAEPQLFHAMSDGSYLDWAAHERFPVFIDGRNEVYGEPFIAEYLAVAGGSRDWEAFADRFGINSLMLHSAELAPLAEAVRRSGRWALVHVDPRELVFVRDIPQHRELIREFRIDPQAAWRPRGPEPEETPTGWRRWIGSIGRPWYSLGMAQSLLLAGAVGPAASFLERALARFPDHREIRIGLAQIHRSAGRPAEAERLLAGLRLSRQELARMDEQLAGLLALAGRTGESIEPLRRAVAARPDDAGLRGRLARAYLESGDYPHAAQAYRAALDRAGRNASFWLELGHAEALLGRADAALTAYDQALHHDPSLYQALYNGGVLLRERGDVAGAAERFRRALRLKPDYEAARQALGRLSLSTRDAEGHFFSESSNVVGDVVIGESERSPPLKVYGPRLEMAV